MRRIYALLWALSLIGIFFLGFQLGRPRVEVDEHAEAIFKHKEDSLIGALQASEQRERILLDSNHVDSIYIVELEAEILARDLTQKVINKHYEKRIKAILAYSDAKLDSFFIKRYPAPGIRYNTAVGPSTVEGGDDSTGPAPLRLPELGVPDSATQPADVGGDSIRALAPDLPAAEGERGEGNSDSDTAGVGAAAAAGQGEDTGQSYRAGEESKAPAEQGYSGCSSRWRWKNSLRSIKTVGHQPQESHLVGSQEHSYPGCPDPGRIL